VISTLVSPSFVSPRSRRCARGVLVAAQGGGVGLGGAAGLARANIRHDGLVAAEPPSRVARDAGGQLVRRALQLAVPVRRADQTHAERLRGVDGAAREEKVSGWPPPTTSRIRAMP